MPTHVHLGLLAVKHKTVSTPRSWSCLFSCLPYPVLPLMLAVDGMPCPTPPTKGPCWTVTVAASKGHFLLSTSLRQHSQTQNPQRAGSQQLMLKGCEDPALMGQPTSLPEAAG